MSKGSKRNKNSDFEASDNSDDDFEKDFRNKKTKKTRSDPASVEKKLRERRSTRVDPDIKKAIELSLKEKLLKSDDKDFQKSETGENTEENLGKEDKVEIVTESEEQTAGKNLETNVVNNNDQPVEKSKKSNLKKKSKNSESDDEEYELDNSDDDFGKVKPKKRTPSKKKPTPNSKKKNKTSKSDISVVLNEKDLNKEKYSADEVNEKVVVSLKFDIPKEEPEILVPNLSCSRKSFSSIETNKPQRKNLNTSLTSNPSPLGRIEIKSSQPQYRVGLSRNSKVKPLHPNVKLS